MYILLFMQLKPTKEKIPRGKNAGAFGYFLHLASHTVKPKLLVSISWAGRMKELALEIIMRPVARIVDKVTTMRPDRL